MSVNVNIQPDTAIAATAISDWSGRVYFQDTQGGIHEAAHNRGTWTRSSAPLFRAKLSTPLAVVSWNEGQEIRLYSVSEDEHLQEWVSTHGGPWVPGYLTNLKVRVLPNTSIAAIQWNGPNIRVYAQEAGANAIQEYVVGNPWTKGATLPVAFQGSSLAGAGWVDDKGPHLRVYYLSPDLELKEHAYDGKWYEGGFKPGKAPAHASITAIGWSQSGPQLRVYWQDSHGVLTGFQWTQGWSPIGIIKPVPEGTSLASLEWNTGTNIRVYYQSHDGAIVETCEDGGPWFDGAVVSPRA